MREAIIKKGDKFNFLTAIKFKHKNKNYQQYWIFRCDCGKEKIINISSVKMGKTKSCGCLHKKILTTHGMYGTRTYTSWVAMKERCFNPNNKRYKDYGGRGITVCPRWLKFENFFEDMGDRPQGKTLDRKNNDKGYCKSNCRYATPTEQNNNKRNNLNAKIH